VSELVTEFTKRRRAAVFNFYSHMRSYLARLEALTVDGDKDPLKSLYILSPTDSIRNMSNGTDLLGKRLCNLACEFLQYLSTKGEQVPPANTKDEWEKWDSKINLLREYLNDFLLIGTGETLPHFNTEDDIENEIRRLLCITKDIDGIIQMEIDKFFEEIEGESSSC